MKQPSGTLRIRAQQARRRASLYRSVYRSVDELVAEGRRIHERQVWDSRVAWLARVGWLFVALTFAALAWVACNRGG